MSNPITVLLLGRSGCGKGTQAELLKKFLEKRGGNGSAIYIYTGEELRKIIKRKKTYTTDLLDKKIMKGGGKAPDFLAIHAWAHAFINKLKPKKHLIIDGSPRTVIEARVLDEAFEFYGRKNVFPALIEITRKEAFLRLKKRGRFDDTDKAINRRLDFYEKYVKPTTEYYKTKSKNKLRSVDGNPRDIRKIHQNILTALNLI